MKMKTDFGLLSEVQDGDVIVARFAKGDAPCGTKPAWSNPQVVTLYVDRREADYKKGHKHGYGFKGELIMLTPRGMNWADYGQHAYMGDNEWLTEEYRMQVLCLGDNLEHGVEVAAADDAATEEEFVNLLRGMLDSIKENMGVE